MADGSAGKAAKIRNTPKKSYASAARSRGLPRFLGGD